MQDLLGSGIEPVSSGLAGRAPTEPPWFSKSKSSLHFYNKSHLFFIIYFFVFFLLFLFIYFLNFILFNFTILYWFCHISKWICHRYTCVPHPEPSSLLSPHTIPLDHPSAPAPSIQYRASNLDWRLVSYMIVYIFQCHSPYIFICCWIHFSSILLILSSCSWGILIFNCISLTFFELFYYHGIAELIKWIESFFIFCMPEYGEDYFFSQFSSVAQLCPTLWEPMNHSTSGLPVHHQLPEPTQAHVHWVSDAIQPSHPLWSPSPPALNLFQHQGFFKWVSSSHQVAKVLEFQLQHQSYQWTPRTDLL